MPSSHERGMSEMHSLLETRCSRVLATVETVVQYSPNRLNDASASIRPRYRSCIIPDSPQGIKVENLGAHIDQALEAMGFARVRREDLKKRSRIHHDEQARFVWASTTNTYQALTRSLSGGRPPSSKEQYAESSDEDWYAVAERSM